MRPAVIALVLLGCVLLARAVPLVGKGCTAVPKAKCARDFYHNCLRCGNSSDYDCEECCPTCKQVIKGAYKFCDCGKGPTPPPGPPPAPPHSPDSWDTYQVAGMDVISVTGGHNKSDYQKVVVLLHGGGEVGGMWQLFYDQGWFGDLSGIKYVFPTAPDHLWYHSYKNGCGLKDDCAYNISSIDESASRVAALIEHEKAPLGGDGSKVYLGGFSEGAQLTSYMQIAKLDFALGGVIVMDGYPLPPLCDMPGAAPSAAKKNATYYGQDMKWMINWGDQDPIFPLQESLAAYHGIFAALEINATLKSTQIYPGMTHTVIQSEFAKIVDFIRS